MYLSEKEKLVEEVPGMAKKSAIKFVENLINLKNGLRVLI